MCTRRVPSATAAINGRSRAPVGLPRMPWISRGATSLRDRGAGVIAGHHDVPVRRARAGRGTGRRIAAGAVDDHRERSARARLCQRVAGGVDR